MISFILKRNTIKKSGFTLIELIFAIVIIGFSVLSLPTMTQVSTKAISDSLAIEAIFIASSKLNQIMTYNSNDNNATHVNLSDTNTFNSTIVVSNLTTNIKRVTLTITKASTGTIITSMNAISCNIKEINPYHKTF
jgi:prepilin-type N-terminal cleavage/methylation domain-containing protein